MNQYQNQFFVFAKLCKLLMQSCFCTPEYAGTIPGSLKNLLEWTVGSEVMSNKRVALINVAAEGRRENAQSHLRIVLGYISASIVEEASQRIFIARESVDANGFVTDPVIRDEISKVLKYLANQ